MLIQYIVSSVPAKYRRSANDRFFRAAFHHLCGRFHFTYFYTDEVKRPVPRNPDEHLELPCLEPPNAEQYTQWVDDNDFRLG